MKEWPVVVKGLVLGTGRERVGLVVQWVQWHKTRNRMRLARLMLLWLERRYGVYIGLNADIGRDVIFPHPVGIVIGDGVRIGDGCAIYQNTTFGRVNREEDQIGLYPDVGRGTVVFAGAVVLGGVQVGERCTIAANAVVTNSMPDSHVAAGVPARIRPKKDAETEANASQTHRPLLAYVADD